MHSNTAKTCFLSAPAPMPGLSRPERPDQPQRAMAKSEPARVLLCADCISFIPRHPCKGRIRRCGNKEGSSSEVQHCVICRIGVHVVVTCRRPGRRCWHGCRTPEADRRRNSRDQEECGPPPPCRRIRTSTKTSARRCAPKFRPPIVVC